ncbi:MAG: hypothetical protein E7213_07770 [Clostridium sp.]|nr:hypothetical protein [Clostridium sp.]
MTIVSILFIFRYIGLFLLCVVESGNIARLLIPLLFLNHLSIPLIVLALSYVFLRWDKLNFNVDYIIALILFALYTVGMFFMNGKVILSPEYGYIINIYNETIVYLISLIILGILLCFCFYFFDKPNNNRWGMTYLIIALAMVITENVLYLGGIKIFPYPIFGDAVFIILINLAVNTFKKKKTAIL